MAEQLLYEVADGEETYFTVSLAGDGRIVVSLGDPEYFMCLTQEQWCAAVEATRSVWEREDKSITRMRLDVESMRGRGEHVPVELAHFLETHPPKGVN